ncbi:MAG: cellulose biosynthesis cyclic di-GMP-binding regulatory protein BcsB [Beijerinckiaceae bacterium]
MTREMTPFSLLRPAFAAAFAALAFVLAPALASAQASGVRAAPVVVRTPVPLAETGPERTNADTFMRHLTNNVQGFRLTGEIGQSEWPIYLTEAQTRRKLSFRIGYLAAISVMPEASKLTLSINDQPIGQAHIIGTRGVRTASFEVPPGLMKPGFNAIRISAEQRHRVDCSLKATYELWTQIDPTQTGLELARADSAVQTIGDLAALPVNEQGALPIRAIAPPRASTGAVERIVRAVQMISLAGRFAQPVVDFGPMAQGDFGLNLAIGPIAQLAPQLGGLSVGAVLGPRVLVSPMGEGRRTTVVVTGRDDADVDEALKQFAVAVVTRGSPEGLRAAAAFPGYRLNGGERIKLRDLGFASQEFSGRLFRAGFNVVMPPDFYPADYAKAYMDVAGGYAPGLARGAQIVVSVNGRNAVSFKLAKASGEAFKHNPMPLPLGSMQPGLNRIEIEAHLPAESDEQCDPLVAASGGNRFLILDDTQIEIPRIARIARMPDLSVTATGAFPFSHAGARPMLAILSPSRETVSAAATLAAHLAIAAGGMIDFRLSLTEPARGEGPALVVGPANALSDESLRRVGLSANHLASIWPAREAIESDGAESLSRFERQARHRLVLQRNFPATCHLPTPAGGFGNAERRAALEVDRAAVGSSEAPQPRDLYEEWSSNLRAQTGLFARISFAAQWPFVRAGQWAASLRDSALAWFEPSVEASTLTRQASLVVAQQIEGDQPSDVVTLVTAPDAATLLHSVDCLVDPRVWRQIGGRVAALNMSDAQVVAMQETDPRLISTQPLSLQNARLIAAGWFSLNRQIYVGLALFICLCLAAATTAFVRNVGRRQ